MHKPPKIETLGARIMRLRKSIGKTRLQMNIALNVSRAVISQWETDTNKPSVDNLFALSSFLGVSIFELWYGYPEYPEEAIPAITRVEVRRREDLHSQALQWLDLIKSALLEMESSDNHVLSPKTQQRRPPARAKKKLDGQRPHPSEPSK